VNLCQKDTTFRRLRSEPGDDASYIGRVRPQPDRLPRVLVFVDIFVEQPEMDRVVAALSKLDELVHLYEVTGEFDIVTLISVDSTDDFRVVLHEKIMKIKGVRSTVSSIVLKAHKGPC
jgi:DNA-binding Lrp family transcriptional regulator